MINATQTLFSGNRAHENGGAIFLHNATLLTLKAVTFNHNTADFSGGAVHLEASTVFYQERKFLHQQSRFCNSWSCLACKTNRYSCRHRGLVWFSDKWGDQA